MADCYERDIAVILSAPSPQAMRICQAFSARAAGFAEAMKVASLASMELKVANNGDPKSEAVFNGVRGVVDSYVAMLQDIGPMCSVNALQSR